MTTLIKEIVIAPTADTVIKRMNDAMYKKESDVNFYWSATTNGDDANPNNYFLVWGYIKSHFGENVTKSVFIFKGLARSLDDLISREGELEKFEKYVTDSFQ